MYFLSAVILFETSFFIRIMSYKSKKYAIHSLTILYNLVTNILLNTLFSTKPNDLTYGLFIGKPNTCHGKLEILLLNVCICKIGDCPSRRKSHTHFVSVFVRIPQVSEHKWGTPPHFFPLPIPVALRCYIIKQGMKLSQRNLPN